MKRYKQILLYVVSTMSSIYNWCERWHTVGKEATIAKIVDFAKKVAPNVKMIALSNKKTV